MQTVFVRYAEFRESKRSPGLLREINSETMTVAVMEFWLLFYHKKSSNVNTLTNMKTNHGKYSYWQKHSLLQITNEIIFNILPEKIGYFLKFQLE